MASRIRSSRARFVTAAALILFAVFMWNQNIAATNVSGPINSNTTWTVAGSPYVMTSTVTVASGVTLTIQPGVVVKASGQFTQLSVNGTLYAVGTSSNRITFTSIQDDSVGGDTGGDGATQGAAGQWYQILVTGAATLSYVDVQYGGYGTLNHTFGAIRVQPSASATLDYVRARFNQRSGLLVGSGATATVAHSEFVMNGNGVSVSNGRLDLSANSKMNLNSDTGVMLTYTTNYTGTPTSILNSEVTSNGNYGVRLMVDYMLSSSYAPVGHENNIYNNASNADGRQLSSYFPLMQADWTGNYLGAIAMEVPCPWAPGTTMQQHLSYQVQLTYCEDPKPGPSTAAVYVSSSCGGGASLRCAADWVKNDPYSASLIDNSGW